MMVADSPDATQLAQEFNPKDHVDRTAEQDLFRRLVTFESRARILVICDGGGQGKSSLLKRFTFNCNKDIKPNIPSYLVELDKIEAPSPFDFASAVVSGFHVRGEENVHLRFANFNRLDSARTANDFTPFEDDGETGRTASATSGRAVATTIHGGGQNIGVQNNFGPVDTVNVMGVPQFTEDQQRRAKDACAEAFFDDLREICATRPMVLIFDGWESCNSTFRAWLIKRVFENHVLHPNPELRPQLLAVVIAGRPYEPGVTEFGLRPDEFSDYFDSEDDYAATVQMVSSLSKLVNIDDILEFVTKNGVQEPTEKDIAEIREQIAAGESLQKMKSLVRAYRELLLQRQQLEAKIAGVFGGSPGS